MTLPLYPYQEEPVDRFLERDSLLVAYEMGLGKTPIAIACAEELFGENEIDTCMIVVPASLKYQWAQRIGEFTDIPMVKVRKSGSFIDLPDNKYVELIDGPPLVRKGQYDHILESGVQYVILGYENVVNDWKYVKQIDPDFVVLDEATAIKTFKAKRTKKVKQLKPPFRLALTGTPIENRPEELYSIMQWVDDSVLGRYDLFDRSYVVRNGFGGVVRYKNLPVLHKRLSVAMSRRNRLDPNVRPYLPEVEFATWDVELTPQVKKLYNEIALDLLGDLQSAGFNESFDLEKHYNGGEINENTEMGKIMAKQTALEMLLDHPELLVKSATDYNDRKSRTGSKYAADLQAAGKLEGLGSSNKLDLLIDEVEDILGFNPDNKVIIFTKYRRMVDIIRNSLNCESLEYHGGMDAGAKAGTVAKFEGDYRVLVSSHAGSYGTDLKMANYLINFDLPWSSGKADQINGRHQRAASEFDQVYVVDMITAGTIEERKHRMLALKRKIGSAILDNDGADESGRIENDLGSLTSALEDGIVQTFEEE